MFNGRETSLIIGLIIKFAIAKTPPEIKRTLKLSEYDKPPKYFDTKKIAKTYIKNDRIIDFTNITLSNLATSIKYCL